MTLATNGVADEVSISDLKDEEYTILTRALSAAASDIGRKGNEYVHFYGADRDTVVAFFNKFWAEDGKLRKQS